MENVLVKLTRRVGWRSSSSRLGRASFVKYPNLLKIAEESPNINIYWYPTGNLKNAL
jgi:hypothetical protein